MAETVPPLPPRFRFRDLVAFDGEDRVRVEFYINEKSFKERLQLYFIKNQRSSLRIRIIYFTIKVLSCVLYVARAAQDDYKIASCSGCPPGNFSNESVPNWFAILWVDRPEWLWAIQVIFALISLGHTLLLKYLLYKGNLFQMLASFLVILEFVNTVPFIITIFWKPLRNLFIPVYLDCWLAKATLENMFNDLNRAMQRMQSALSQQQMILLATLLCLVFSSMCGLQHLERAGYDHSGDGNTMTIFQSFYFVIVTFSTVGYGDIQVDFWHSQLYLILMIIMALVIVPYQLERLAYLSMEKQKQGGTYSKHRAQTEHHVVVCVSMLQADLLMDFLNEFYAHQHLQDHLVVLLSPSEMDDTIKMILQVPIWAQRVIFLQGSALRDQDLARARMEEAEGCFILTPRNIFDRNEADQQTILRTWAVKDYAPNCPLYVQILKPENQFHIKFADFIVCEEQFKFALLANNCLAPGISTFITLLIHTSRGIEGNGSESEWQRSYGRCSGNELYHIRLGDSKFFGEYEHKSFTYASFHAHKKYGVALIGIQLEDDDAEIQLNPGCRHIMSASDVCFYMNLTKEENSAFILADNSEDNNKRRESSQGIAEEKPVSSKVHNVIASVGATVIEFHHHGAISRNNHLEETSSVGSNSQLIKQESTTDPTEDSQSINLEQLEMKRLEESCDNVVDENTNRLNLPRQAEGRDDDLPVGQIKSRNERRPSIAPVLEVVSLSDSNDEGRKVPTMRQLLLHKRNILIQNASTDPEDVVLWDGSKEKWKKGYPPIPPYIGHTPMFSYLVSENRHLCCCELDQPCQHSNNRSAKEYNWPNNSIIVAAEYASPAMYNFIVPLRVYWRPKETLKPIVILVEKRPDNNFLESIASFPMVYFSVGSIESLDDLLRVGILHADYVVVVDKESSKMAEEDYMADSSQIVAVQTMFKLFPSTNIITELTHPSNMKFMQFRAKDYYALRMGKKQKKIKEKGSSISYMFRLPFAAGNVFTASMLDTLLYQSFVKDYMITVVRLLLGLDQAHGSGYLCEMKITTNDLWIRTYGRLYQKLCSTTFEIPIGLYKTRESNSENKSELSVTIEDEDESASLLSEERRAFAELVRTKMKKLNLPESDYDSEASDTRSSLAYVLINPSFDTKLEVDDVVYVIRPAGQATTSSPMPPRRHFSTIRRGSRRLKVERQEPQGAFSNSSDTRL